jgi:hypothetical protein
MHMKLIAIIITGIGCLLITGCKDTCSCKKVACPQFNDPSFDTWFPYNPGQQIIFKTLTGKTDTITFGSVIKSGSYEANKGCTHADHGCIQRIDILSGGTDSSGTSKFIISYNILTPFTSTVIPKKLELRFHQFNLTGTDVTSQGLQVEPGQSIQSQSIATVNLNGSIFSTVQVLQRDTAALKNTGPYKLYLSQNTGLAAYETYPGGELWVKQ